MLRSLFSGVSGLRNHQTRMDVIGNNIANVNTLGYKTSQVNFKDIFSQTLKGASAPTGGRGGTNPMQVGLGVSIANISVNHTQGSLQSTGRITDLGIEGDGFFIVSIGDEKYYTRAGNFELDSEGYLVSATNGYYLLRGDIPLDDDDNPLYTTLDEVPNDERRIQIPSDAIFIIDQAGDVNIVNDDGSLTKIATIGLAKFNNPGGLLKTGDNLYVPSNNSGVALEGIPGENGSGSIMPGTLEMSNVDLAQEFTDMIITQRGFQANSRIITVSDEILNELINLKR
ncbi:flagellar basal body rod protein FlgG [Anaerobranca gottschalkii]|uniref:Flagellar hook protein FlgE n=1 Tax=Anaerobranca gottschalkii DSM 13577 TaxID=1120990 RepID=A0A1H9ZEK9_9FIRM|nr:flagellar basal body rod protein FlgG [Anaerobranca gottschalkii]SES79499.1 flagellar hook protein FlgE [Anaerobranca gottschalkii DSM 13577]